MEENGSLVKFIFNPDREAVVEENSSGLTRYIRSSELIARNTDAARTYYHYVSDEMGSTTHIVDEDGIVLNHYTYDAWGNLTAQEEAVPNRFKFTGQQLDPVTQQYYLRARFYNPVIARFTQEDTYRGDGLNLYAYCQNNPVFYTDPSGYAAKAICDTKADAYRQKQANGEQLTRQEWEELRRYERAHNNPNYKLERDERITPTDAYHRLHPNQSTKPKIEIEKKFNFYESSIQITNKQQKNKPLYSPDINKWYKKEVKFQSMKTEHGHTWIGKEMQYRILIDW
ncbi:hypothetical protein B5E66_12135 [Faecalibacterium sp. An121]|nr:RHS repeat-associated core domain-containing protein [Faecalibacterium sp. An121]OUQ34548.1 hypothetical protein B5E66_12135 [Faecalibacterium sp. An121]